MKWRPSWRGTKSKIDAARSWCWTHAQILLTLATVIISIVTLRVSLKIFEEAYVIAPEIRSNLPGRDLFSNGPSHASVKFFIVNAGNRPFLISRLRLISSDINVRCDEDIILAKMLDRKIHIHEIYEGNLDNKKDGFDDKAIELGARIIQPSTVTEIIGTVDDLFKDRGSRRYNICLSVSGFNFNGEKFLVKWQVGYGIYNRVDTYQINPPRMPIIAPPTFPFLNLL